MNFKAKVLLYLGGIFLTGFLLGFVVGSFANRYTGASPRLSLTEYHSKAEIVKALKEELNLTGQQVGELEKIVDVCRDRFLTLRRDFKPRSDEIVRTAIAEIHGMLAPEQARRFDQFLREHLSNSKQAER